MDYSDYIVGILLISVGLLVAKYPGMLNVMTKEQKQKTDMDAVGRMARRWLLGMGLCQIVGTFLIIKFGSVELNGLFNLFLVVIGSIGIAAKTQSRKYRK